MKVFHHTQGLIWSSNPDAEPHEYYIVPEDGDDDDEDELLPMRVAEAIAQHERRN